MSNLTKRNIPTSYAEADALLGRRDQRRISASGLLYRNWCETKLRLHDTDIVTFRSDGTMILCTGGWNTPTTRSWMKAALRATRWTVNSDHGVPWLWQWNSPVSNETRWPLSQHGVSLEVPVVLNTNTNKAQWVTPLLARKILSMEPAPSGRGWMVNLECGHKRHFDSYPSSKPTRCWTCEEQAPERCIGCGAPHDDADRPRGGLCAKCR